MPSYNPPKTLFEKLYADLSERSGRQLYESLALAESLRPRYTTATLLGYVFAGLVHTITLALAVQGLLWLVAWPAVGLMVLGLIMLGIAIAIRPRLAAEPAGQLARDEYPRLYELADVVAENLGVRPVDGIIAARFFNASYGVYGWRRRRIVRLGLPLLAVSNAQEKVALIAHELGHAVNGDSTRGLFVGTAVDSLSRLHHVLDPDYLPRTVRYGGRVGWMTGTGEWIGSYAMLVLAAIPWAGAWLFSVLFHRQSQRAEYLADQLAAEAAGAEATISSLRKLNLANATFLQTGLEFKGQGRVFEVARKRLADPMQLAQFEKLSPAMQLNATHPPTALRIAMLRAHPASGTPLVFSARFFELLDKELAPMTEKLQQEIEGAAHPLAYI